MTDRKILEAGGLQTVLGRVVDQITVTPSSVALDLSDGCQLVVEHWPGDRVGLLLTVPGTEHSSAVTQQVCLVDGELTYRRDDSQSTAQCAASPIAAPTTTTGELQPGGAAAIPKTTKYTRLPNEAVASYADEQRGEIRKDWTFGYQTGYRLFQYVTSAYTWSKTHLASRLVYDEAGILYADFLCYGDWRRLRYANKDNQLVRKHLRQDTRRLYEPHIVGHVTCGLCADRMRKHSDAE